MYIWFLFIVIVTYPELTSFGVLLGLAVLDMLAEKHCKFVHWSTTFVQTEISQQLLDWIAKALHKKILNWCVSANVDMFNVKYFELERKWT